MKTINEPATAEPTDSEPEPKPRVRRPLIALAAIPLLAIAVAVAPREIGWWHERADLAFATDFIQSQLTPEKPNTQPGARLTQEVNAFIARFGPVKSVKSTEFAVHVVTPNGRYRYTTESHVAAEKEDADLIIQVNNENGVRTIRSLAFDPDTEEKPTSAPPTNPLEPKPITKAADKKRNGS